MRRPQIVSVRAEQAVMVVHQSLSPCGSSVLCVIRVTAIIEIRSGHNNKYIGLHH